MKINKKEFIENLDSVLKLFRQFRETMTISNAAPDQNFMRNFDEIIRNYQIIREEIPDELISRFGMPIQVMALQLVEQLRQELDGQRRNDRQRIGVSSIDDQLRKPGLYEKEINALLDKRNAMMKACAG